jgi:hypothetical protein
VRGAAAGCALVAAIAATARVASAQQPAGPAIAPELRADVIVGRDPAAQLGGGVQIPVGYYVRVGVVAAVGVPIGERGATTSASPRRIDARFDVLTRFLLDPFRQSKYGLSLGGGMSLRAEPGERARPLLLVAFDVEGRRSNSGWVPAVQLGLGGGARIGVVLRRGALGAR